MNGLSQLRGLQNPVLSSTSETSGPFLTADRAVRAHAGFDVDLDVAVIETANCEKVATVPFLMAMTRQHESEDEFNS
ncbi:unnamed protein product, partial [marine sediment metagenome]